MKEKWKQVEGYEGLYEICNFGRVKGYEGLYEICNFGRVKGIKLHMAINGNMQAKNRIRRL
jgi:hypothetical protein